MATKEEFVKKAIARGMNRAQIKNALNVRRKEIGAFDDDQPAEQPTGQKAQKPFFGLPPKLEKTIFPRATEAREKGGGMLRTAIPGAMDVISTLGRGVAATPALIPGGETFQESFARKEAKPQKGIARIGEFIGSTLRDPATVIGGIAAAPAKAVVAPLVRKGAGIATRAAVPAITRQAEISSREGTFEPQQIGEAAIETGLGVAGELGGAIAAKGISKAGKALLSSGAKVKDAVAKRAGPDVAKGVENIVNDIVEFKLEAPTGGFKKMAKNANARISSESKKLDDLLNVFSENNPSATVDIDDVFIQYLDDIQGAKINSLFGSEDQAAKVASNIHKALDARKLAGVQPVANLRKIKKTMNEGLKLFKKGKFAITDDPVKTQVGELAQLRIAEQLNKYVPEAKTLNNNMRRLINARTALEDAHKRTSNKNFLDLRSTILAGGGLSGGLALNSPEAIIVGLGAAAMLKAASRGRGASTLLKLGGSSILPTTSRIGAQKISSLQDLQRAMSQNKQGTKIVIPQPKMQPLTLPGN